MQLFSPRQSRTYMWTALVLGAVAIGSSPILIRLSELQPTATAFYRVAIAALPFALAVLWTRSQDDTEQRAASASDIAALIFAGALFGLDLGCLHWSLKITSVANAILFLNTAPFFVLAIGWLLFGERIEARLLANLFLAMVGLAVLVGSTLALDPARLKGDGLALIAGAAYGGYLTVVSRLRHLSVGLVMAVTSATSALFLLPAALMMGEDLVPQTARGWLLLLALALLTHAAGQGLIALALARLRSPSASAVLLLQPVVAALAAWLVFAEALSALQILGGLVVLLAVYLCQWRGQRGRMASVPEA